MKIKIFFAAALVVALSGCTSVYTSIEPAAENGSYYVTEVSQNPFGIFSDLLVCKSEDTAQMVCESVD